jgi:cytochrome c-type biogenesis protein CcmH
MIMRSPAACARILFVLAMVSSIAIPCNRAVAVQPDEVLSDPALETRARAISRELRCMVCQNQSIDDSEAPLARDLRVLVRERLKGGDNDRQVLDFLVARYGDFVLLKPRFTPQTALLWLLPPALLGSGAVALVLLVRRRGGPSGAIASAEPLSTAEQARLAELVDRTGSARG